MSEWEDVPDEWEDVPEPFSGPAPESRMPLKSRALQIIGEGARQLGLAGRSIMNTVAGPPLIAMDAGINARNLMTGANHPTASEMWRQGLNDLGVPEPRGGLERGVDIASQMLLGSKIPGPQGMGNIKDASRNALSALPGIAPAKAIAPIPEQFGKVDPVRIQQLQQGNQMGLRVPPSTTNPSIINRLLESWGGKEATKQDAAARNAEVFKQMAQRTLGLHADQPVTKEAVKAVIADQSPAYETIKQAGTMVRDDKYANALAKITQKYETAAKSFPGLAKDDITKLVQSMDQPEFSAEAAIEATKILRANADDAFRAGNSQLGRASREISNELEKLVERNLARSAGAQTDDAAKDAANVLLVNFKAARKNIAKAKSVDKAIVAPEVVSGIKLAQQLEKGVPLTGQMKQAAQFAQSFPQVSRPMLDSGSVRNTDFILGGGAAAVSSNPSFLMYPFSRMAVRDLLLSKAGQKMAVPSKTDPRQLAMMAAFGLSAPK